jgi:anti-sigma B factor antagonist
MSIGVNTRHVSGITLFDLSGRLVAGGNQTGDTAEGDTLREILLRAYEQGNRWLLLNCEDLTDVDSCGVGELAAAYATIVRRGGVLKLLNPNQRLADLLAMTGLDSLFDIYDDELIAIASFNRSGNARTKQKLTDYLDRDV